MASRSARRCAAIAFALLFPVAAAAWEAAPAWDGAPGHGAALAPGLDAAIGRVNATSRRPAPGGLCQGAAAPRDPIPELDGRRLINPADWERSRLLMPKNPWDYYGAGVFRSWLDALRWVQADADGLPLGVDLLKALHRLALKEHYFKGFEARRIQAAFRTGRLSETAKEALLRRLDGGERLYFSGADHASLAGTFRSDPLDEFAHNGEQRLPDGTRYMTSAELEAVRRNPLLHLVEGGVRELGTDRYLGEALYPRVKDVAPLVESILRDAGRELAGAKDPGQVIGAVTRMQRALLTVHPFLDGNGRTIRLLADLLYQRHGLPPPLEPFETEVLSAPAALLAWTVRQMDRYCEELERRLGARRPR